MMKKGRKKCGKKKSKARVEQNQGAKEESSLKNPNRAGEQYHRRQNEVKNSQEKSFSIKSGQSGT